MRRDQLEHAIRTACQIIGHSDVIVVGSQSILGTFREEQLPPEAAGEFSPFEELHGFSIDGVDLETSALPEGWRDRLVKVQNPNTAAPAGEPQFTGWCLDKEDLCVAKLCALREKDRAFVAALLAHGLVDPAVILERVPTVGPRHQAAAGRAAAWISARRDSPGL